METHILKIELSTRAHKALEPIAARVGMTREEYVSMFCEEVGYVQPEQAAADQPGGGSGNGRTSAARISAVPSAHLEGGL